MGFSLLGLGFEDGVLHGKQKNSILLLTFMLDEMRQESENKYKTSKTKKIKINKNKIKKVFFLFFFYFFLFFLCPPCGCLKVGSVVRRNN